MEASNKLILLPGIAGLALAASGAVAPAIANDTACMGADEMEAALVDWYSASPVETARTATTDLWVSDNSGVWALVEYSATGTVCVIAKGDDWAGEAAGQVALLAGTDRIRTD